MWRSTEQLLAAVEGRRGVEAADRLCEACVTLFDIDAAAISLVFDGANSGTLGSSGAPARMYDELQFTLGEGPCLDSVARTGTGAGRSTWPTPTTPGGRPTVLPCWPRDPRRVRDAVLRGRGTRRRAGPVPRQAGPSSDEDNSPAPSSPPNWPGSRCWTSWTATCRPPSATRAAMPGPN